MKFLGIILASSVASFALTLSESVDIALENSTKTQIAKSQVKQNQYIKDQAEAAFHPVVDAAFNWQETETKTLFANNPTYNYSLGLKYNLFNGFSDYFNHDSKELELEAARLALISVEQDLRLSVIAAYNNFLKAQKTITTQKEQLDSLTQQYNDTNAKYEQGMVAKNELLLIEVEQLKAEQALIRAKSDLVIARDSLGNILGRELGNATVIEDFDASVGEVEHKEILFKKMMQNRSEIRAMEYKSKSLITQKDAVRGNYLPKINLEARYQINDEEMLVTDGGIVQPEDQLTYKLNASWTLYSGMANISKQKEILEQNMQQNLELHQLKLDLKSQLIKAYEDFAVAQSGLYVSERAKVSAEENYRITSDRYAYGDVDTLTLLVSQSNLTQAENAYNNAYYDLYLAYKTLERITSK